MKQYEIITGKKLIDIITENQLEDARLDHILGHDIQMISKDSIIIIHKLSSNVPSELATYQFPSNWKELTTEELEESIEYYYASKLRKRRMLYEKAPNESIIFFDPIPWKQVEIIPINVYSIIMNILDPNIFR